MSIKVATNSLGSAVGGGVPPGRASSNLDLLRPRLCARVGDPSLARRLMRHMVIRAATARTYVYQQRDIWHRIFCWPSGGAGVQHGVSPLTCTNTLAFNKKGSLAKVYRQITNSSGVSVRADRRGLGAPCPPLFPKACSFQAIFWENPYFEQILGLRAPLGSKLHWALLAILDPLMFSNCVLSGWQQKNTSTYIVCLFFFCWKKAGTLVCYWLAHSIFHKNVTL